MTAQLHPMHPTVTLSDGVVHIHDLVETDPGVVAILAAADDDLDAATHTLLRIGAHSVQLASTDLDTQVVERRFDALAGVFDTSVTNAVFTIEKAASDLLDNEHGTLPATLAQLRGDLSALLGETFDPESKTSALTKIESVVQGTSSQLARSIRSIFSLDEPDSPLARTRRELTELVRDEVRAVGADVRTLQQSVAAGAAVAEVADKLTSKGVSFEELIAAGLSRVAGIHSDIVEACGRTTGSAGTRKGDLLVTVCSDDTGGRSCRFVIEAKDQKLSMTKTLAELDAALANHDATAAIAIFAGEHLAPTGTPFWYSGNRAVLVYDKTDPDPNALQLAYEWARWLCRRSNHDTEPTLDVDAVTAAIERARQALKRHQTIKACHSAIKNKADEARTHVADLVSDVNQAIDELLTLISDIENDAA